MPVNAGVGWSDKRGMGRVSVNGAARSVIVVGNYRPSLTVVRALAAAGFHVIVGREGVCHAHRSSQCTEIWDHPPIAERGEFVAALHDFLDDRPDVAAVFPVSESAVVCVAGIAGDLPTSVRCVAPASETVDLCLDKPRFLALARETGVPVKPFAVASDLAVLHDFARSTGFPLVVRPLASGLRLLQRKALIIDSEAALTRQLAVWPAAHASLLVQEYARGTRYNLYFAARSGTVLASGLVRVLRTDRVDGTGLAVDGETLASEPVLGDFLERLVARLGYHGVGCAQFLFDRERNEAVLLELNPRLGANFAIVHAAGLQLANLACELHGIDTPATATWQPGLRYAWLYGDLAGLAEELGSGALAFSGAARWLRDALVTQLRADVHLTFARSDPMPTMYTYGSALGVAMTRMSGRVRAR